MFAIIKSTEKEVISFLYYQPLRPVMMKIIKKVKNILISWYMHYQYITGSYMLDLPEKVIINAVILTCFFLLSKYIYLFLNEIIIYIFIQD